MFASLALMVAVALAGCGGQAVSVVKTVTSTVAESEKALPMATQLVVGTFRLEDTAQAINAEQAQALLPLWKAYRNMSGSTSSSPVEMQALLTQIHGAMKEEQLKAIADLKLTPDDMMKLMQERGIDMTNKGAGDTGAASTATRQAERPSLGSGGMPGPGGAPSSGNRSGGNNRGGGDRMPGGAMPAGGDPGMGSFPGEMPGMGTPSAQQQGKGAMATVVPPPLYDALIDLLKSRA